MSIRILDVDVVLIILFGWVDDEMLTSYIFVEIETKLKEVEINPATEERKKERQISKVWKIKAIEHILKQTKECKIENTKRTRGARAIE